MKINVTCAERLSILNNLIPQKGNMLTMATVKDLEEKLKVSVEEIQQILADDGKNISIDKDNSSVKDFEISSAEYDTIIKEIDSLDRAENIPKGLYSLIRKLKDCK